MRFLLLWGFPVEFTVKQKNLITQLYLDILGPTSYTVKYKKITLARRCPQETEQDWFTKRFHSRCQTDILKIR